jgi:hypothetical protein
MMKRKGETAKKRYMMKHDESGGQLQTLVNICKELQIKG